MKTIRYIITTTCDIILGIIATIAGTFMVLNAVLLTLTLEHLLGEKVSIDYDTNIGEDGKKQYLRLVIIED